MSIQQLEQSYNGCIILDEAHKAKNLQQDSKTARFVIQLQRRLPNARVVYCSATGVSDVSHMVYAERLGLWNTTTTTTTTITTTTKEAGIITQQPHYAFESFADFQQSLERRGLGSLELLALEMKQQGCFLARTLSWEGAEFQTCQIPLSKHQTQVYDQAVAWWTNLKLQLQHAMAIAGHTNNNTNLWRNYWSAHQRFLKELAICGKVQFVAEDAKRAIQQKDCCVVIGLQTTGDASLQSILLERNNKTNNRRIFPKLVSTAAGTLTNFVQNHFPVAPPPPEVPKVPEKPSLAASLDEHRAYVQRKREAERIAALPPPLPLPELLSMRQDILRSIQQMDLPPNPLDDLIDRLGGVKQVAEMTGRPGRIVRHPNNHQQFVYSKRGGSSSSSSDQEPTDDNNDRINLVEKQKFMDGKKSVAIISDAASTGISLHAARNSLACHKRRIHYTIELPWSADKAVQQLGRSHRSGQHSAPIYKLVVSDLGGERRFAAAVSKRMQNLGALTKGDRRAATGSDMLADFDLDSRYGKKALKRFYTAMLRNNASLSSSSLDPPPPPGGFLPSRNSEKILDEFAQELRRSNDDQDAIIQFLLADPSKRRSACLILASQDLIKVGLMEDSQKAGNVKVFLNRIFGLPGKKCNAAIGYVCHCRYLSYANLNSTYVHNMVCFSCKAKFHFFTVHVHFGRCHSRSKNDWRI